MRVTVRRQNAEAEIPLRITTEFIKLEAALKLANAVPSGGMAKNLIAEGEASVNGDCCTMRGKKLYPGDTVDFMGQRYRIVHEA